VTLIFSWFPSSASLRQKSSTAGRRIGVLEVNPDVAAEAVGQIPGAWATGAATDTALHAYHSLSSILLIFS
jgi:hypothetical protein